MKIELSKDDLVALVIGTDCPYELINKYSKMDIGHYIGGFVDEWKWNVYGLKELSEEELYKIYQELKQSK